MCDLQRSLPNSISFNVTTKSFITSTSSCYWVMWPMLLKNFINVKINIQPHFSHSSCYQTTSSWTWNKSLKYQSFCRITPCLKNFFWPECWWLTILNHLHSINVLSQSCNLPLRTMPMRNVCQLAQKCQ